MKETAPLKYSYSDRYLEIVKNCKDNDAAKLIIELHDLIIYQKDMIKQQRIEIISLKHKEAWKRYDKPTDNYDPSTRKYTDRPSKINNEGC